MALYKSGVKIIKNVYHHHNIDGNSRDSEEESDSTYSDSYVASSSGGCFTTPKYNIVYGECGYDSWTLIAEYEPLYDGGPPGYEYKCNYCGNVVTEYEWNPGGAGTCTNQVEKSRTLVGYTRSCGKKEGQLISTNTYYYCGWTNS